MLVKVYSQVKFSKRLRSGDDAGQSLAGKKIM
jgi:hypothetical protein